MRPPPTAGDLDLSRIARRQRVRVVDVTGDDALAARLRDHGLWPGVIVELVTRAPGGDPLLFALHGYQLALRIDEAQRVRVAPEAGGA